MLMKAIVSTKCKFSVWKPRLELTIIIQYIWGIKNAFRNLGDVANGFLGTGRSFCCTVQHPQVALVTCSKTTSQLTSAQPEKLSHKTQTGEARQRTQTRKLYFTCKDYSSGLVKNLSKLVLAKLLMSKYKITGSFIYIYIGTNEWNVIPEDFHTKYSMFTAPDAHTHIHHSVIHYEHTEKERETKSNK